MLRDEILSFEEMKERQGCSDRFEDVICYRIEAGILAYKKDGETMDLEAMLDIIDSFMANYYEAYSLEWDGSSTVHISPSLLKRFEIIFTYGTFEIEEIIVSDIDPEDIDKEVLTEWCGFRDEEIEEVLKGWYGFNDEEVKKWLDSHSSDS